jgi:hypothetical protein
VLKTLLLETVVGVRIFRHICKEEVAFEHEMKDLAMLAQLLRYVDALERTECGEDNMIAVSYNVI